MVCHQLVEEQQEWNCGFLLRRTGYQLLKRASARGHSHNQDSTSRVRTQLLGAFTTGHLDKCTGPCRRTRGWVVGSSLAPFPGRLREFEETQTFRRVSSARAPAGIRVHPAAFPPGTWPPLALQDSSLICPPGREFSQSTQPCWSAGKGSQLPVHTATRAEPGTQTGLPPAVPRDSGQFPANFCPRLRTLASAKLPWLLFSHKFASDTRENQGFWGGGGGYLTMYIRNCLSESP